MELTKMKIGGTIAALRKAKNLTQEQLAAMVGVSAPAVSKWETDNSYPDITLLCPLARALGTDVDTLLQFEPALTESQITEQLNMVLGKISARDLESAEAELNELLHQYPNCAALKYNAAVAYGSFRLFFPDADAGTVAAWQARRRNLLEEVRAAGSPAYWQSATLELAGLAIAEGELEAGGALLEELPERTADPTFIRVLYHLGKEEPEEALKLTQRQLYKLVHQVLTCLSLMTDPRLMSDPQRRLHAGQMYGQTARAFGVPDISEALIMEIWLALGQPDKAAHCFARYVTILLDPVTLPDSELFSPGLDPEQPGGRPAFSPAMRRMLVKTVTEQERYRPLFDCPEFTAALEQLQAGL